MSGRKQLATKAAAIQQNVPASKVRSAHWFVRVDGEKEFLRQKCEEFSQRIDVTTLWVGYHTGETKENPHIHACIELNYTPQKQTFALQIKKHFGVDGSSYALEVWDNDREKGACSYLYHEEDAEIFHRKGISDSQIVAAKAANEAVQKVVAMNKEKAQHKLIGKTFDIFNVKSEAYIKPSKSEILYQMYKFIRAGENYHPGDYLLKRYVEEVEFMLTEDGDLECLAERNANRWWN